MRSRLGIVPACGALALFASAASAQPPASPTHACAGLLGTSIEDTVVTLAQLNAADPEGLPEHCQVQGEINRRVSPVDGQAYAIKFHLRLPTDWNRRFYYQGGGGVDGSLGQANAAVIHEGYAVVSTDSGHENGTNVSEVAGNFQFGFDPQARSDYGYNGPAQVTEKAKALIEAFYGKRPKYSYFVGCSEGGREGLMLSQRYPEYFDGIVSGNPGMDLPKAAVAEAWDSQAFAAAAAAMGEMTAVGNPHLGRSFTDEQLSAVSDAILAQCDGLDGLEDGMVFNPQACDFDPASLGPSGSGVLSPEQVVALEKVFGGARNSSGEALYAGWYWDPGIAEFGWRIWKLGVFDAPVNTAINVTLGGGALPFIFTTPPNSMTAGTDVAAGTTVVSAGAPEAFVRWVLSFNMDTDAPKIFATDEIYTESAMDFMGTSSTDYRRFRKDGNKLIVYTGQADPVFSAKYHVAWYEDLIAANGGLRKTQKFARLYLVPGMNHCGGGPSPSQFDAFGALVDWVERGQAPRSIVGTAGERTPWPGRTRPLCAYPEQARHNGHGDIEDAASFRCEMPAGGHPVHGFNHPAHGDDHPVFGRD